MSKEHENIHEEEIGPEDSEASPEEEVEKRCEERLKKLQDVLDDLRRLAFSNNIEQIEIAPFSDRAWEEIEGEGKIIYVHEIDNSGEHYTGAKEGHRISRFFSPDSTIRSLFLAIAEKRKEIFEERDAALKLLRKRKLEKIGDKIGEV
jgi:hypothetical protein